MKKILLITNEEIEKITELAEFQDFCADSFECIVVKTPEEGQARIESDGDIPVILVDSPSRFDSVGKLIDYVNGGNQYLHSIAILILTGILSISFSFSTLQNKEQGINDFLKLSDQNMYLDKQTKKRSRSQ